MKEIIINKDQATAFAASIYMDIAEYIKSHQVEYQKFLAENGGKH